MDKRLLMGVILGLVLAYFIIPFMTSFLKKMAP